MASGRDEKVVQLSLENKDFNRDVDKSIESLDELKKALEFKDAGRGLDALEKEIKMVDLSPMEKGVERVSQQFNLLTTIADTTFRRITNSAIDAGENLIKSLSVDQVTSGWSQYEDRMTAVQRIMSATSNQFSNQEAQISAVNTNLEKLTWFTDETSFHFLDMVNNMGKFTANDVKLDVAANAMQGISTWAALSGANMEEAGRSMYNLAQAISVGSVKLIDWKSIQNANMATSEFKNTAIETAIAFGTLSEVAPGVYKTLGSKDTYDALNLFSDGLKDAWLSSDVLLGTLDKYGGYANKIYDFVQATGVATTSALNMVDDYIAGTLDMNEAAEECGITINELKGYMSELGSSEYELGRRALRAAQETKTLSEALDYVKTAVSSGWARTFELIFGEYNESKAWWSDLSEWLYDVFVAAGDARNEMLGIWRDWGGADDLMAGLKELQAFITEIIGVFQDAWDAIWPQDSDSRADRLFNLTKSFREFAEGLHLTESAANNLRTILSALFGTLKNVGTVIKIVFKAFGPLLQVLNQLAGAVVYLVAKFTELFNVRFDQWATTGGFEKLLNVVTQIGGALAALAGGALGSIIKMVDGLIETMFAFYDRWQRSGGGISGLLTSLEYYLKQFWNQLMAGETIVNRFCEVVLAVVKGVVGGVVAALQTIVKLLRGELSLKDVFNTNWMEPFQKLGGMFEGSGVLATIGDKFRLFGETFAGFVQDLFNADSEIRQSLRLIGQDLLNFVDWTKKLFGSITIRDVKDFALIAILWMFVDSVRQINLGLKAGIQNMTGVFGSFNKILKQFTGQSTTLDKLNTFFNATKALQIGITAMLIVNGLAVLNTLDYDKTIDSIAMLGVTLGLLLVVYKKFGDITSALNKSKEGLNKTKKGLENVNVGTTILAIAASVSIILASVKLMTDTIVDESGEINTAKLGAATRSLAVAVGMYIGMVATLSLLDKVDTKSLRRSAGVLISMALAIDLMLPAIFSINKMAEVNPGRILASILAIDSLVLALGYMMKMLSNNKNSWGNILAIGPSLLMVAGAFDALMISVVALSALPWQKTLTSAGILGGMFLELSVAIGVLAKVLLNVKTKNILAIGSAMTQLALSMDLIAASFLILDQVDWPSIKGYLAVVPGGFAELAFALGALAIVLKDVKSSTITSIGRSLTTVAFSFIEIAGAFFILGQVDFQTLGNNIWHLYGLLGAMISVMGIVAGFEVGGIPVAETLIKVGEAFQKFGVGILAAAGGIAAFSIAFNSFFAMSAALGVIATTIEQTFGIDMGAAIERGTKLVFATLDAFIDSLLQLAPKILAVIAVIWAGVKAMLFAQKHELAAEIVLWGIAIAEAIIQWGEPIMQKLGELLDILNNNLPMLQQKLDAFADNLGSALGSALTRAIIGAIKGVVQGIAGGLGLDKFAEEFTAQFGTEMQKQSVHIQRQFEAAMYPLTNGTGVAQEVGYKMMKDMIAGFEKGEVELTKDQYNAGVAACKAFEDGHRDQGQGHSPYGMTEDLEHDMTAGAQVGFQKDRVEWENIGKEAVNAQFKGTNDQIKQNQNLMDFAYASSAKQSATAAKNSTIKTVEETKDEVKDTVVGSATYATEGAMDAVGQTIESSQGWLSTTVQWLGETLGLDFAGSFSETISRAGVFGGGGGLFSFGGGTAKTVDVSSYIDTLVKQSKYGDSVFSQLMNLEGQESLPSTVKASKLLYDLHSQGEITTEQLKRLRKEWGLTAKGVGASTKEIDTAYSGLGDSIADSIGSGTNKATGAAKSQVSAVEQTYKDALSQIDLDDKINELQYKLWVAENPNATAAEKEAMDLARATDEINFQMERVQLAQEQYVLKSTELGENSKDAQEALKTYLNAQIKLVELQNKATETTAAAAEDHAKAFQDAARQYQETLELVDKFGFSQDQLMGYWNSLTKQYGIQDLAHSEEEIKKVQERLLLDSTYTGQLAGSSILTAMDQTVSNGMSGVVETVRSFPQKAADEISTNSQILSNSMYMLKQNAQDAFMNENGESAWANRGREVDNGLAAGISENRDVPVGATGEMSSALVDEAKSVLDIHSPSGVFIEIGSAIIDGLVLSINNGRSRVVTAIVSVVEAAIRASMDAAGIASPSKEMEYVGKMMDAGLSVGLENGGKTVANTVAEMMGNLKKQAMSSSDDLGSYLRNTFDLSQDDANINLVVDIDPGKALSDLNQIETAERGIGSMLDQYIDEALSGKEHTIKLSFDTTQLDAKLSEYQKEMSDANKRVEARNNAASEMRKFLLSSGALLEVGGKTYRTEGYYNAVRAFESHSGKSISNSNTPGEYDRANAILQDIRASQEKIRLEELMKELMNAYDTSDITINFTQNNTSPRPLNAVDIYRDTKKQLDDFKTAIDKRTLGQLRR